MNIGRAIRVGRVKKEKGHDRTGKKSQKGYHSPIWGEASTEAVYIKNSLVSDVLHLITCAKFQNEISGATILQGSNFPISY